MKSTQKKLFTNLLVLVLCLAMLTGTTFAWFTDSVTSSGNIVKAGNLELKMYWTDDINGTWHDVEGTNKTLFDEHDLQGNEIYWEPGYTEVRYIKIQNTGDLAFNFDITLEVADPGDVGELAPAINVYAAKNVQANVTDRTDLGQSGFGAVGMLNTMMNGGKVVSGTVIPTGQTNPQYASGETIVAIALQMIPTAGNEYQGKDLGAGFNIKALATQCAHEEDAFGNNYDGDATPGNTGNTLVATTLTSAVASENGMVSSEVIMSGNGITATVPAGAKLADGVSSLTLTVNPLENTASNISVYNQQTLIPVDIHINGLATDNTVPVVINLGAVMPVGLNLGNFTLVHVEDGNNVTMTRVDDESQLNAHNTFTYDPATGEVSVAMATFSEVALISDDEKAWNGTYATAFAGGEGTEEKPYLIANADQFVYFGDLISNDNDNYGDKHYKLIADVNFDGNNEHIFYPIGYHKEGGTITTVAFDDAPEVYYEINEDTKTFGSTISEDDANTWYTYGGSFKGTFDGNGHTISNIYQNTWSMKGNYSGNYWNAAMGLFGYVNGGTVKNLTVDNFSSDGEFTPTGVIAAYAANSTFENIAITNCNPRVYNTGNGGIVGIGGNSSDPDDYNLTFTNITIDNSNKISALWGSWDVACGGLVGMFRGAGHVNMTNCHVAAQIDVYNDVCGNYQYYWYRYAGMMVGTNKNMTTDANGYTVPETSKFHAENCTVHFGNWNDYYYCELVANSLASYTHDHQFSRLEQIQNVSEIQDANGNWNKAGNFIVMNGKTPTDTCYHIVSKDGVLTQHTHESAGKETVNGVEVLKEDKQRVYLPFNQLFTGYGWGVKHIPVYNGEDYAFEGITILDREVADSVEKFETKFTGDFLYRVGNSGTVPVGKLFKAKEGITINDSGVYVTVDKIDENSNVSGTFTANTSKWTEGTIHFSGTGLVKVTIQDYEYCKPTELILEVVDAVNATAATSATANNVVLLNDISGGFTVSGRYTVYGNGFTLNYTGNGQYSNNGLKQGIVTVSENGTVDNLRINASIYPSSYMYYGSAALGDYVQSGPSDGNGRYYYQLSAVAASGNATISNCYIYGGRNNIFVNTGDVTIKDSVLESGVVANVQIQSNSSHTIIFEDVTTIQHQVNPTLGDISKVMLGAGIIVGPETNDNPALVLNGEFKQYNWVNEDDKAAVSDEVAQKIIDAAVSATAYNHTINGKTASNLGIIYMNDYKTNITNNTVLPYVLGTINISGVSGQVYSPQGAAENQIYSDYANADRDTVNGIYKPQFKYSADLGGQYVAASDNGDEHCYREGDTIHVMFPSGDSKILNLETLVSIEKYSGQDLGLTITCKDGNEANVAVNNGTITLSKADNYTVTYAVKDGEIDYSWNVTLEVSLKDKSVPNAYFIYDSNKQTMGYAKKSAFAGGQTQYLPFLAGLKIYDYNGQTPYLRFDGDNDFNKIASATITGYTSANHVLIEVKLTDGGVINVDTTARAASGGSTYTGKIQTSGNTVYYVNDGTTSATTTTWVISNYSFVGNNGVTIDSGSVTFANCENGSVPTGSFGTTINYTVSYDVNGGNCGQTTGYATSVAAAVTLPTPTRSGYIFAGWYTAASGGTRVGSAGESYTPSSNITLYAQWGLPCTVTYNANGGSCVTESAYYDGAALTLPTATRDGYWFIGWYDAASGGNKIGDAGAAYNPSGEITLYAHWQEQIKYTVSYDANGGTCGTASVTYEGTTLTLPTPTRTGYTFNGWYTAASGGTKVGDAGATYSPNADITLYAQWKINSYTISVTTSNATVTVNNTTVSNGGSVSIPYGTQVTVAVTYSKNSSQTTTITGTDGTTYTSPFTMPAQAVTINASSKDSCVTPDTLVTLADGSQKRIDEVTYEDQLLVWDFVKGEYTSAPSSIVMNHGYNNYDVVTLNFADGTVVNTINGHGFFDESLNKFVIISKNNVAYFVGHKFIKEDGTVTELADYSINNEYTESWSVLTAEHYNCILEGMLTVTPAEVEGSPDYLMPYAVGEDMKYDSEAMQADIEKYGIYTYEEFADLLTPEQFYGLGLQNFKVAVGKGYITYDEILFLIDLHMN